MANFNTFFIAFRLETILNKQKIIKKIAFLVKMAKMVNFRPNHKISSFVARSGKIKKKYTEILGKDQI
jgi:hypothetical protein